MITEGQIRRITAQYAGRGREFAYLELAQEHFLHWMVGEGLFDGPESLVFKGGTAIRKFWLGPRGRFSTDLDFGGADAHAEYVLDSLSDGIMTEGVAFRAVDVDPGARKATWRASAGDLGDTMVAKIEFSSRPAILAPIIPQGRPELPGLRPDVLGFDLPLVPLMRLDENLAEKLARFRRTIKARDVYDLAVLAPEVRESMGLVRQLTCCKVYMDIVRDGLAGEVPFRGGPEYLDRRLDEVVDPDDLGLVVGGRTDLRGHLATIATTFGQMGMPTGALEERLARVDRGDLWWATQQIDRLRAENAASVTAT